MRAMRTVASQARPTAAWAMLHVRPRLLRSSKPTSERAYARGLEVATSTASSHASSRSAESFASSHQTAGWKQRTARTAFCSRFVQSSRRARRERGPHSRRAGGRGAPIHTGGEFGTAEGEEEGGQSRYAEAAQRARYR